MYRRHGIDDVSEDDHDAVFGSTFAAYSESELEQFILPFEVRLAGNGLDAVELFEGRQVLDAGCGGGRGSLLMMRSGAASLTGIDVSAQNVTSTRTVLERAGFPNVTVEEGSLEHLPYSDGQFDFVWCNGVLMHTAHPSETLREIVRVLRPGGQSWIYVYGAGGTYWRVMAAFRRTFAELDPTFLIKVLNAAGIPTGRVAEMLDDWKAPFLRTYEDSTFASALVDLGCDVQRLLRGMPYDTSEQLTLGVSPEFVGEGDLRYLVTRGEGKLGHVSEVMAESLNGSHLVEADVTVIASDPSLERRLARALEAFEVDFADHSEDGILLAARAQLVLRDGFLPSPSGSTLGPVLEVLEQRP